MLTLDEDLLGIRADDSQVKNLSIRKADKERSTADTVACALSCVVTGLRFWRRIEGKTLSVKALVTDLFSGNGSHAVNDCTTTVDRWYKKESFKDLICSFGSSLIFSMPSHIPQFLPFVVFSYMNTTLNDDDDCEGAEDNDSLQTDGFDNGEKEKS